MGKFPIDRARQELGVTPTTGVRANIDVSTGEGAIGRAVAGAGRTVLDLGIKYDLKQANIQLSAAQRLAEDEYHKFEIERDNNLDPDTHQQAYEVALEKIQTFVPKNKRGAAAYGLWLNKQIPSWQVKVDSKRLARADDNWDTQAAQKIADIKQDGDPNKLKEFEKFLARRQTYDPMDKSKAAKLLSTARVAQVEGEVAFLVQMGMAGDFGKKEGEESSFDKAKRLVQSSSSILGSEKTLTELRSIEMLEAFTLRKTKDLRKLRNLEINESFIPKLIGGNLKANEVQQSALPEQPSEARGDILSKSDWMDYAAQSYEAAPTISTSDGLSGSIQTVINFGQNKLNKEQAYKELLDARYLDGSITDAQLLWGLVKITDPYPKNINTDLQAVLVDNRAIVKKQWAWYSLGLGRFRESAGERAKSSRVSAKLIEWLDLQIEAEKPPTTKELYKQAEILRAQDLAVNGTEDVFDSGAPVAQPKSQAEYDALPSGTQYLHPDGRIKEKP